MANRKFLIDGIIGLAQKLGANPNKFMGTKQNITFLGTGDKGMKGTTFSGKIDENFIDLGFTKDDLVKIIEQDAGYVTAGKLNDVQLNTMYNNLLKIDETFNPPPGPMNVIDLETGTVGLNKQGLESLRETDKIKRFTQGLKTSKTAMTNKIKEGIEGLKTKLTGGTDDIATKAKAEESFLKTGVADFSESIQAEGARRAVLRQVLAKDPDFFMLPPEITESIAKFKDLQRGGANAPDPLVVFRNIGNFTDKELKQIDFIIDQKLFDDTSIIADDVLEYIKEIRPEGFRPGFRSGKSVQGLLNLINRKFGKDTMKVADEIDRPESALLADEFAAFNTRNKRPYKQGDAITSENFAETGFAPSDEVLENLRIAREMPDPKPLEGKFTKAEFVIQRMKNSIKDAKGKTDSDSKYIKKTFPNMIKEIEANPTIANNPNVWKMFSEDLPKNQRVVVYADDSVDFFRQTEFGPQNIKSSMDFAKKHDLTLEEASRILKMEPEDQILEITRIKRIYDKNLKQKNIDRIQRLRDQGFFDKAKGGLAGILEI